jgi:heat-inducible transcriptional repressor
MEMDERKNTILKAIIDDYILTGVPIGSQTISQKYIGWLSAATIRNEMADLEEMGYLAHPHTSAGRIPLERAYRLYVDRMMHVSPLKKSEADLILGYFAKKMDEVEQVINRTASAISDMTQYISVVLKPQFNMLKIKTIQLVPVTQEKGLVIIVTDTGIIKEAIVRIPAGIETGYLQMISSMLTERLQGKNVNEIDDALVEMASGFVEHTRFFHAVVDALKEKIQPSEQRDVIVEGTNNILRYPEYADIDRARSLLQALETKDFIYKLLSKGTDLEFSISIGTENEYEPVRDCSIVTATYSIRGAKLGSFGVIGPIRMNYAKVVSLLGGIGASLNQMLCDLDEANNT